MPATRPPCLQRTPSQERTLQRAPLHGAPTATGTERRASFRKVTTWPCPGPVSIPSLAAEATTPYCGEPPGGEGTEGTTDTRAPAPVGTWTFATTNSVDTDAPGSISAPEDPQSLKSPTSAQAEDEHRECLGSGRTSSELHPETRALPDGRTAARHRTAGASTTGGTGLHTAGGCTATPAPTTNGTQVDGTRLGAGAEDEEEKSANDAQRSPGSSSGAAGTAMGSGRTSDGTATPGGGSSTTEGRTGDSGGGAVSTGHSPSHPRSPPPEGAAGNPLP
ncbi:mucin-21-like [Procambarus clarkii]|uniref:mucin-21-like n=1 Tax=Procambarus clarkii TaxID=6728 RepID=UPI003742910B